MRTAIEWVNVMLIIIKNEMGCNILHMIYDANKKASVLRVSSPWFEVQKLMNVGALCVYVSHENLPANPGKDPTRECEDNEKECGVYGRHRYGIAVWGSLSANNTEKFDRPMGSMCAQHSNKALGLGTPRASDKRTE